MFHYAITTLGCKVNQYETQAIESMLAEHGFEPTGENADVVIVNTCAVTAESGRKSRQTIRHLMQKNPKALLAVGGCYSQIEPEKVKELGADIIFGSADRTAFVQAIIDRLPQEHIDDPFKRMTIEPLHAGAVAGRTRAMMKIQDGCDNFCTYCIIPYSRGRVRSLPVEEAVKQAKELQEKGFAEIVLTGIEIASYGKDLPGKPTLADVTEAIAKAVPNVRLHFGSIEPTVITEAFCQKLSGLGNVCRHFHLSLQSGCDDTLKRMHRKYNTVRFYEACQLLWTYFPQCSLTADLIAGFPGETESDFSKTLAFVEKCGFSYVHCFPYSVRPGTKAAAMEGQLPHAVKDERVRQAMELVERLQTAYLESCIGSTLSVLFETENEGHAENYSLVCVPEPQIRGTVKPVRIVGVDGDKLLGITV